MRSFPQFCWGAMLLVAVGSAVQAHDDDPKLLDRQPVYVGAGYRGADAGLAGRAFTSSGVQLLAWLPVSAFGPQHSSANTVEGYVSPSGTEYAVFGVSAGTAFVRLSDPSNPEIITVIPGPDSLWRDVRVFGHYAYSVSEGGSGIQIMSMANIDANNVSLVNTVTSGGSTSTHTVFINKDSGYLYRCGGGSTLGIRIYDLNANPTNPPYVGIFNTGRYTHECQVVSYTSGPYAGKEIAFMCTNSGSGGGSPRVTIFDVTNKAAPVQLSQISYSNSGFSHQAWVSDDRNWLYLNDEFDESNNGFTSRTRVFNVSNLSAPTEAGWFTSGSPAVDHNLYVKGNLIFESNYRSGLRIFDRSDSPTSPTQIAWFDTYPADDAPSYNSLWDNYPFLPSGIVLGSDIEQGLFVWWVGEPLLKFTYPNGLPANTNPFAPTTLTVQIEGQDGGEYEPGSGKLHYDIGSGFQVVALTDLGGGAFEAQIPAAPCGQTVTYFFSAQSTNGLTWRDPTASSASGHTAVSATDVTQIAFYDMELAAGWVGGAAGDTATTGIWVRVNPNGTAAQPEDDHSPDGTMCWVTGQGSPGGGVGDADVDGGKTTLLSPVFDLAAVENPVIGYWRWYSNNQGAAPNEDVFPIDITADGTTWVNVETVGPGGPQAGGGWYYHEFRVNDFITPTSTVRMRFVAQDLGAGSIVEAALDDFSLRSVECEPPAPCPEDLTGDGFVDQADLAALLAEYNIGPGGDINGDGITDQADLAALLAVYNAPCP